MSHLRSSISVALSGAALLLLACSSSDNGSADDCGDTSTTTLTTVKSEVFVSCQSASCHGNGGRGGDLDLATDPHKAMVGVPPDPKGASKRGWTVPAGLSRVTPGDEAKSFLYLKLTMPMATEPLLGHRMPDTGQTLDACSIQKVRDWIRRGAPND